jgi:hypothetical protein
MRIRIQLFQVIKIARIHTDLDPQPYIKIKLPHLRLLKRGKSAVSSMEFRSRESILL